MKPVDFSSSIVVSLVGSLKASDSIVETKQQIKHKIIGIYGFITYRKPVVIDEIASNI